MSPAPLTGVFINGPLAGEVIPDEDGESLLPVLDDAGRPIAGLELPTGGYYTLADERRPVRLWEFSADAWRFTKLLELEPQWWRWYRWTLPDDVDDRDLRWLR